MSDTKPPREFVCDNNGPPVDIEQAAVELAEAVAQQPNPSPLPIAVVGARRHTEGWSRRLLHPEKLPHVLASRLIDIRSRRFSSFVVVGPVEHEHFEIIRELEARGVARTEFGDERERGGNALGRPCATCHGSGRVPIVDAGEGGTSFVVDDPGPSSQRRYEDEPNADRGQ